MGTCRPHSRRRRPVVRAAAPSSPSGALQTRGQEPPGGQTPFPSCSHCSFSQVQSCCLTCPSPAGLAPTVQRAQRMTGAKWSLQSGPSCGPRCPCQAQKWGPLARGVSTNGPGGDSRGQLDMSLGFLATVLQTCEAGSEDPGADQGHSHPNCQCPGRASADPRQSGDSPALPTGHLQSTGEPTAPGQRAHSAGPHPATRLTAGVNGARGLDLSAKEKAAPPYP